MENRFTSKIGGEFELSFDFLTSNKGFPNTKQCTNGYRSTCFVDSGRSALLLAARDLKKKGFKSILLPRYNCTYAIKPFKQEGLKITYYTCGENLDEPTLPERYPKNTAILYIHYFGFKNNKLENWIDIQKKRGNEFLVIEDNVMAFMNSNTGNFGDYVIESYRKFFPVTDGALIKSKTQLNQALYPPNEEFISKKFSARVLRKYTSEDKLFLSLFSSSEDLINGEIVPRHMSPIGKLILNSIDLKDASEKRIQNWNFCLNHFHFFNLASHIQILRRMPLKNEVPMFFTILVSREKRNDLRNYLISKNIFCPVHWPLPNIEKEEWPEEFNLNNQILSIPIDQRYDSKDIERCFYEINNFFNKG
ncbi:MAG: hypothetical protein NXH75_02105 [Halobacteriovoraceae bacterium]|nr:hypothetical protein [Halobacteriovoraceae bacterium]